MAEMERLVEQAPRIGQLRRGEQSFFRMPGNLASYRMRERAETDYRNAFKYATAKGIAEGMAQGKAEGIAEGEAKGRADTARRMLEMNLTPEQIAQATQLSLDEIKGLMAEE